MSLSTLLLAGASSKKSKRRPEKVIDADLDALFRSTAAAAAAAVPTPKVSEKHKKKRKSRGEGDEAGDRDVNGSKDTGKKKVKIAEEAVHPKKKVRFSKEEPTDRKSKKKGDKRKKEKAPEPVSSDGENDEELEKAYTAGKQVPAPDSDDEGDPTQLVHESVATSSKKSKSTPAVKTKFIPEDETPDQRDSRTIFVGNLSAEVAQKRPLLKQLQRHILSQVPSAKIESTRFRSIAFQKPTSKLPTSDDDEDTPSKKSGSKAETPPATKEARPHDRERTATWRADQDETEIKADDKTFLNPKQKKKIAFINREFHSTADSVNAYIVFSHPASVVSRPANLPPPPETMDPYEAARLAVEKCDGSLFMERMIRVDLAKKDATLAKSTGNGSSAVDGNPKLSVFLGNVDFGCKEEDLRVFFEGVVSAERGPPGVEDDDGENKPKTWVTRVRIVRDKETQLGKGFAYIQFADRECVDEVLALEESKLKFAKRKLRVQRCKTLPAASNKRPANGSASASPSTAPPRTRAPAVAIPIPSIPKGDPLLGGKLAHLPKDERKQIKSSDADRVARRLAKKKARSALEKRGVKAQVKDRDRVRKTAADKKGSAPRKVVSKGRIRSEKSVSKRNAKK